MGNVRQLSTNSGGSYQGAVYPKVEMDQTGLRRSLTVQQRVFLSIPTTASCGTGTVKVVG